MILYVKEQAAQTYTCPQGEVCDYDQAQTSVNNAYGYDANGNQATRTIGGVTSTLGYDAEGRLISVTAASMPPTPTPGPSPTPAASATLSATATPTPPPTPVFSHAKLPCCLSGKSEISVLG